jgi:hypothetical protein
MSKTFWSAGPIFLLPLLVFQPRQTVVICESADIDYAVPAIKREVERVFLNPVILVVHGDKTALHWTTLPDKDRAEAKPAQLKVEELRRKYPDRPIVLWVCNPNYDQVRGKNVWFFLGYVWKVPYYQPDPEATIIANGSAKDLVRARDE